MTKLEPYLYGNRRAVTSINDSGRARKKTKKFLLTSDLSTTTKKKRNSEKNHVIHVRHLIGATNKQADVCFYSMSRDRILEHVTRYHGYTLKRGKNTYAANTNKKLTTRVAVKHFIVKSKKTFESASLCSR